MTGEVRWPGGNDPPLMLFSGDGDLIGTLGLCAGGECTEAAIEKRTSAQRPVLPWVSSFYQSPVAALNCASQGS